MITSADFANMNDSAVRQITARVELFDGSTLLHTFLHNGKKIGLQEIAVTRTGEHGKFFGFGICQRAVIKVIDSLGAIDNIAKGQALKVYFSSDETKEPVKCFPTFYIKEFVRDEKTNVITITAYDALDNATAHVIREVEPVKPYYPMQVAYAIQEALGLKNVTFTDGFTHVYENGANFGGDETLRVVLNALAEATQTIYYVTKDDILRFNRIENSDNVVCTIPKSDYFELTTGVPAVLSKIVHVTELGENVFAGDNTGVTQYVRDNPFWNNSTDIGTFLAEAIDRVGGLTIIPYNIKWRGNFLTELCDKVALETKKCEFINTFILDDTIVYNGGLTQTMFWEYKPDSENVTAANPVTIGDKLNQTFARVDKVRKEIELVAQGVQENSSELAELKLTTDEISLRVEEITEPDISHLDAKLDAINRELDKLVKEVNLKVSSEDVTIAITNTLSNGVDKVVTSSKKYTFDDVGLNIGSSDNSISTTITEDGMRINRSGEEVLTADNTGVKAEDLHATTYLIIGKNSRLEDWQDQYTACFWIGD